jgi:chemotaxis response regulator CheB
VVAGVCDGIKAVEAALEFRPDILILDICMDDREGIHAAREIKRLGLLPRMLCSRFKKMPTTLKRRAQWAQAMP